MNAYSELVEENKRSMQEIEHLKSELDSLNNAKSSMSQLEYEKNLNSINNYINKEQEKIKKNNIIISNFDFSSRTMDRLKYLRELLSNEKDIKVRDEINEEIIAKEEELKRSMENLNPELASELYASKLNVDIPNVEPPKEDPIIEEPEEVNIEKDPLREIREKIDVQKNIINRQKDQNASRNFVERMVNLTKSTNNCIDKIKQMEKAYSQIEMKWADKKSAIIREKADITTASMEERKIKMDNICDELDKEIEEIENDNSLTNEEKEAKKQEKYTELEKQVYLIEEFPNLSQKEQDKKLDEELEIIDKQIYEEQRKIKKQMGNLMTMQILLLGRYLKKGYSPKEVYEALTLLAEIKLEDKELEKYLHKTFDETLLRNPELRNIYIAYSEKAENEKENNKPEEKQGVDLIEALLDEAEKNLDRKSLDKACELIKKLPNNDDKNDLQQRAAEINNLINEKEKNNENEPEEDELEDSKDQPELPQIQGNSPKKTWKTWVALAAGIGVGAAVFFTVGTVGVSVMAIAGGIAKTLLNKRRKKLQMQRLSGELPVEDIEEPLPGIKGKIQNLKKYFKSEEFCRDAVWFLNGAIYTGLGLNIASSIYNIASSHIGGATPAPDTPPSTTPQPVSNPTPTPQPDNNVLAGIRIGDKVGSYNVSVGHDTAAWATSGTHTENLLSQFVNGDSIFKRFALVNSDGTIGQIINTNGLSVADFCSQTGIDPSQIAVDVANDNSVSQAWTSIAELTKGVGGRSL